MNLGHDKIIFYSCIIFFLLSVTGLIYAAESYKPLPGYIEMFFVNDSSAKTACHENICEISFFAKIVNKSSSYDYVITATESVNGAEKRYVLERGRLVFSENIIKIVGLDDFRSKDIIADPWGYEIHLWHRFGNDTVRIAVELYEIT